MLSSFHGQTVKGNATAHNNREQPPKYLLIHDNAENEFKQYIENRKEVLEKVRKIVKNKTGRSMQESAVKSFWQEAVINIKEDTKLEDIERLFKNLNEHFKGGFELSEIAIHKDEGAFIESELNVKDIKRDGKTGEWFLIETGENVSNQVKAYMPNENIFYNKQNKNWYLDKEFEIKAPDNLQKYFNLHAHAIYNKFNYDTGKTVRMKKSDLQKIQDITAETLGMIRTNPNQKFKRRSANQQKEFYKKIEEVKSQSLAKQKDLKAEITKLREELKEQKARREDYARLEQLNRELKERIRNKDLKISELNELVSQWHDRAEKYIDLENQNKTLESEKTLLIVKVVELEEKINSRPNMSDYKDILEENKELKKENEILREENTIMEKALNWLGKTKEWAIKAYNKITGVFNPKAEKIEEQEERSIRDILYGDKKSESNDTEIDKIIRRNRK